MPACRAPARPVLAALLGLLLTGCVAQSNNSDSTRDDPEAGLEQLVRTPQPLPDEVTPTDPR